MYGVRNTKARKARKHGKKMKEFERIRMWEEEKRRLEHEKFMRDEERERQRNLEEEGGENRGGDDVEKKREREGGYNNYSNNCTSEIIPGRSSLTPRVNEKNTVQFISPWQNPSPSVNNSGTTVTVSTPVDFIPHPSVACSQRQEENNFHQNGLQQIEQQQQKNQMQQQQMLQQQQQQQQQIYQQQQQMLQQQQQGQTHQFQPPYAESLTMPSTPRSPASSPPLPYITPPSSRSSSFNKPAFSNKKIPQNKHDTLSEQQTTRKEGDSNRGTLKSKKGSKSSKIQQDEFERPVYVKNLLILPEEVVEYLKEPEDNIRSGNGLMNTVSDGNNNKEKSNYVWERKESYSGDGFSTPSNKPQLIPLYSTLSNEKNISSPYISIPSFPPTPSLDLLYSPTHSVPAILPPPPPPPQQQLSSSSSRPQLTSSSSSQTLPT
jgi:hypothetical protein